MRQFARHAFRSGSARYGSIHIKNGTVITLGDENTMLEDHSVIISDDGLIERICPTSEVDKKATFDDVLDASGHIVLPGFINAHMHFYSSFARGLGKAAPSKNFVEILENLWWRLDKQLTVEDSYWSALIACINAIKHGTTTIIDHHASPFGLTGSLDACADAVLETGLRASLCYEVSDRDGPEVAEEGIQENLAFLARCEQQQDDMLTGLFGLHASFTITNETLARCAELGRNFDPDMGFHIHTAEALSDQTTTQELFGSRVIERLAEYDILGPRTICGHCIHLEPNELDLLAETDSIVVHNPQSNMNNAVGIADIVGMVEKGILVGLGTDAMTVNMMEELRSAMWAQKLLHGDPSVAFMEVVEALMVNNRKIVQRLWKSEDTGIGELAEGGVADVILMEYHPPTPFDVGTFYGHLVFGISQHKVDTTIAAGKILMREGRLTMLDEEALMKEAMECGIALWDRF